MPELAGDDRQQFVTVLQDGTRFSGYVVYEKDARHDLELFLGGWSQEGVTRQLLAYAQAGGKISRGNEQRDEWSDRWKFCYHLWPEIDGQPLYVEARFDERDPTDPTIRIVRIHSP